MNSKYFLVCLIILSIAGFASYVSITMYPNSNTYVMRTYELDQSGIFVFEPSEIKGTNPSEISISSRDALIYIMRYFDVNRTKTSMKSLNELLNESKGSIVKVVTQSGAEIEGTLVWYDGNMLGVKTMDSLQVFNINQLISIKLPTYSAEKTENYTEKVLSIIGSSLGKSSKITLGYVKNDLSWDINYDLYIYGKNAATLKQYAGIINNGDEMYNNAKVTLTMVNPNFVMGHYLPNNYVYSKYAMKTLTAEESMPAMPPSISTSLVSGVWSYSLDNPLTIPASSKQKLEIFSDNVPYISKYVWESQTYDKVYRVYNITNSRKEILPAGTVRVFENDVFIGEDSIDMLPSGSSTEMFVSDAPQFTVSRTIVSQKASGSVIENRYIYTVTVQLYIKNTGTTNSEVEIREPVLQYSDYEFVNSNIKPTSIDPNRIIWVVSLAPGSEQTITYSYKYSSRY